MSTLVQSTDTRSSSYADAVHIHHPQAVAHSLPSVFSSFPGNDYDLLLPLVGGAALLVLLPVLLVLALRHHMTLSHDDVWVSVVAAHFVLASG